MGLYKTQPDHGTRSGVNKILTLPDAAFNTISHQDPYHYTCGRFLKDDKLQRKARYISFDFPGLRRKVIKTSPRATKVVSYFKAEGNFSRAFVMQLDGASIVARIPFQFADPSRLRTNSEVATMAYGKSTQS